MGNTLYLIGGTDTIKKSDEPIQYNYVTVARSVSRTNQGRKHRLNKTIYADGRQIPYDHAYHFNYYTKEIFHLGDLADIVKILLGRADMCLLRGIAKDDTKQKQRRALYDDPVKGEATIIEQSANWFALDVDASIDSSGDIVSDSRLIRHKLGLDDIECFAIPSANYRLKHGIRLRMFFWNSIKLFSNDLKKHFKFATGLIDPAMFNPIQPVYIARPNFIGLVEPCNKLFAWLTGDKGCCSIESITQHYAPGEKRPEMKYTKKQAEAFVEKNLNELENVSFGVRHSELFRVAVFFGKLSAQGLVDEDEVKERLCLNAYRYWSGDRRKDQQTVNDGFKRGWMAIENE